MITFLLATIFAAGGPATNGPMHKLISHSQAGVLSSDFKGTPFGSFMPYILDKKGNPVVFVSDLARHTENIKANPKCSFTVHKLIRTDVFNSPRITLSGKMVKVSDKERKALSAVYLKAHPGAKEFIEFEDFNFYRLEVEGIYWVGQFGDIQDVELEDYRKLFE
jgi:putative heme iron utilization protein